MIELIFALVIMGVVFVTLPIIMLRDSNSIEDNLIQESIFLSSSKMSQILTFQWDNSSTPTGMGVVSTSDVVDGTGVTAGLGRVAGTDFRVGHFQESNHRRMTPFGTPRLAGNTGTEIANVYDDIDDFQGLSNVNIIISTTDTGYKKLYRADVNVSYISDGAFLNGTSYASNVIDFVFQTTPTSTTVPTNLKMIEVSMFQDKTGAGSWQTEVLLRAYVANIGETDYFSRRY
jgi:hypothetical protein